MIRSLAKFLIQYYYDSNVVSSQKHNRATEKLPGWLRRWTDSDSELRQFELELQSLERSLASQAESFVSGGLESKSPDNVSLQCVPTRTSSPAFSPLFLASLAAGIACFLLTLGWFLSQHSERKPTGNITSIPANGKEIQAAQVMDSKKRERWILSALNTTKRLASDLRNKSEQVNDSVVVARQTIQKKGEHAKEIGLDGLKFVTQRLPVATVRMMGMNSKKDRK
jgi:hypothetical protein